jgi:hypothetical protein
VVVGSTGQPRPNGLYDLVFKIEASIREDEKQLGIGPANRLRLRVALSESAKSLAEINCRGPADRTYCRGRLTFAGRCRARH